MQQTAKKEQFILLVSHRRHTDYSNKTTAENLRTTVNDLAGLLGQQNQAQHQTYFPPEFRYLTYTWGTALSCSTSSLSAVCEQQGRGSIAPAQSCSHPAVTREPPAHEAAAARGSGSPPSTSGTDRPITRRLGPTLSPDPQTPRDLPRQRRAQRGAEAESRLDPHHRPRAPPPAAVSQRPPRPALRVGARGQAGLPRPWERHREEPGPVEHRQPGLLPDSPGSRRAALSVPGTVATETGNASPCPGSKKGRRARSRACALPHRAGPGREG